jgi:acyl-CoA reductase-like NAD-dependent aldehyde dehydrogenase
MYNSTVQVIARQSRYAARQLSSTSEALRNLALSKMADALEAVKHQVLEINAREVMKARQDGQSEAMIKRLTIASDCASCLAFITSWALTSRTWCLTDSIESAIFERARLRSPSEVDDSWRAA